MNKDERAALVMDTLQRLYPNPAIPLGHRDPFTLLVAVLLSAQSTDVCVNRVTPALFALAATPQTMANSEVSTIEDIIRPCGLAPRKARALVSLSRLLLERHQGQVPDDLEALEALPGVGHKTASVIMAQVFSVPAFPVDTHIHRLMHRWGLSSGKNVKQTERDAKRLFPRDRWIDLHLQIIYFGREYCPARGHDITSCPICSQLART